MPLTLDPAFAAVVEPIFAAHPPPPSLTNGDAATAHIAMDSLLTAMMSGVPPEPTVTQSTLHARGPDGHKVPILAFHPPSLSTTTPQPAILHLHGGGYIGGTAAIFAPANAALAAQTGRPVYGVEYRLAPKYPFPTPIEDVYAALTYLHSHAAELNIDPARIAVYGESAGGGLAFALALLARNRGLSPPLAAVVGAYPMIDDRTTEMVPKEAAPFLGFKEIDNTTGWKAYLGERYGTDDVPGYAAPSREVNLKGLPYSYIDVGGLDLFVDEDIKFAGRLLAAGNEVELHVWPGLTHGFEAIAPGIKQSRAAWEGRKAAMTRC